MTHCLLIYVHDHQTIKKNNLVLQSYHPQRAPSINHFYSHVLLMLSFMQCRIYFAGIIKSHVIVNSAVKEPEREFGCPSIFLASLFFQNIVYVALIIFPLSTWWDLLE